MNDDEFDMSQSSGIATQQELESYYGEKMFLHARQSDLL